MRSGILVIHVRTTSSEIFCHSSSTNAIKTACDTFFFFATMALTFFSIFRLRIAQIKIFSIGLRSGLYDGQDKTRPGSFNSRSPRTSFEVCLGSLSCWKIQRRFPYILVALSYKFSLRICRYKYRSIFSTNVYSPTFPHAQIAPHTWSLNGCFTIGAIGFLYFDQAKQVFRNICKVVSSENTTLRQS